MKISTKDQMTLGDVMDLMTIFPDEAIVPFDYACSYRGYYDDLALITGSSTVADFLNHLNNEVYNKELYGYKGGEFYMDSNTAVWVENDESLCSNNMLVSLTVDDNNQVHYEIYNEYDN